MFDYSGDQFFLVSGGSIQAGPRRLPKSYGNTSGIWNLTEQELFDQFGFAKQVRIGFEPFDPETQNRTGPANAVVGITVESTYTVTNKTAQELDDEKTATATSLVDRPEFKLSKLMLVGLYEAFKVDNPGLTPNQFINFLEASADNISDAAFLAKVKTLL